MRFPPELRRSTVPIDDVKPAKKNPRRGDVDAIRESLRKHGQYKQILVRRETSEVLVGNHTWHAAKAEGWTKIAVLFRSVPDDDEAQRIILVDNRTSDLATYDLGDLSSILKGLPDLEGTGFDAAALDGVLIEAAAAARRNPDTVSEVPVPPKPARPKTRRGDVIRLGDHVLVCGDSTSADDVARAVDAAGVETVDLIFTSPPYNADVHYSDHDDQRTDWEEYGGFLRAVVEAWLPKLGKGRVLGWNIGVYPMVFPHRQAAMLEGAGLTFIRQLIWRKQGVPLPKWHLTRREPRVRRFTPNPTHELVLLYAKGAVELGENLGAVDPIAEHDVFSIHQSQATKDVPAGEVRTGSEQSKRLHTRARKAHPAVFPIRLPSIYVHHFAAPGEVVADPFAGAGTTMLAAEQLGRRSVSIEIDRAYCDVAVARWETMTGNTAKRPRRRSAAKRKETTK